MAELGVKEESGGTFVRSSGRGGQHLNKTSSAVQVRHLPPAVRPARSRTESIPKRFLARRELLKKCPHLGLVTEQDRELARIRKQKSRRSRRSAAKQQTNEIP